MTDTHLTSRIRTNRPVSGRGTFAGRLLRSIRYDVRLVVLGSHAMADAVMGESRQRDQPPARLPERPQQPQSQPGRLFGYGVLTSAMGMVSWFLVVLLGMAVVRGAFYGFVEDGPFGPGTWGGPTKAGAWAAHAAISVPIVVALLAVFRGIHALHLALTRRAGWWVLPATISVCVAGMALIWSWLQQL